MVGQFKKAYLHHSYKKRKDSMGTRPELVTLGNEESNGILEPIFLYHFL